MASSNAGRLLTISHRQQQVALRAAVLRDINRLWPLWDGTRVADFGAFSDPATTLVRAYYRTSAGLASRYYTLLRAAEGVGGEPVRLIPDPPPVEQVVGNLRATGLAGTMRGVRAGLSPQAARQSGLVQAMGSAGRMVLRGAGDTLTATSQADGRAQGWTRVTGGSPCDWCAGQAGPTSTDDFQSHDHCSCTAEVVFT